MNLETIIAELEKIKPLQDATLEEIAEEVEKTSSCVVVDRDVLKETENWFEIRDGSVWLSFETVNQRNGLVNSVKMKSSFRKIIATSLDLIYEDGSEAEAFCRNARKFAAMLTAAAKKVERESKTTIA